MTALSTPASVLLSNENPPAGNNAVVVFEQAHELDHIPTNLHLHRRDLPEPSTQRLQNSLSEWPLHLSDFECGSLPKELGATPGKPETVLYLAYGSNLCAETFQGKRGIRPLSAINVVVPGLVMTFDLPGIPYSEPCFANTKYRRASSRFTPPSDKSPLLPTASEPLPNPMKRRKYHDPQWDKGLVGVVYEVSLSDYAHIIATEGGGASYQDILTVCHPLPSRTTHVPSHPSTPPFKARTLFSPIYPPGEAPPGAGGRFSRPDPDYAQPSARYLKLITDGADEHSFPVDYKAYLHELRSYTMTTTKQRLGGWIFRKIWLPVITVIFRLNAMFADKKGRTPKWLAMITGVVFRGIWICYDGFFYPVFGDGERTQENESNDGGEKGCVGG
ncbi:MAG: hypothetical protein Q9217_005217 [Psora testacea]